MKPDLDKIIESRALPADPSKPRDESRRILLRNTTVGLIAGLAGAFLPGVSRSFAADNSSRKILIAYYSRSGNTRELANQIHQQVGGDMFELKTVHSYPKEYRATTDQAKREQEANFRPQLTAEVQNMGAYDTVFVGYPNWWGTMPMVLWTFLEHYDLTGKTIAPFCTNEGSGMGASERDLKALCPGAKLLPGLSVHGSEAANAAPQVTAWAKKAI